MPRLASLAVILLCVATLQCTKLEGEFGFKSPFDDHYKKILKTPEFKADEKRDWVFVFKNVSESFDAGVFIMKKEIVWAEVTHYTQKVSREGNVVYGTLENLPEGRYKIVITAGKDFISEKEFIIYSDDDT